MLSYKRPRCHDARQFRGETAAVYHALAETHGPVDGYHSRVSAVALPRSGCRTDTMYMPHIPGHSERDRQTVLVSAAQYRLVYESRLPYCLLQAGGYLSAYRNRKTPARQRREMSRCDV